MGIEKVWNALRENFGSEGEVREERYGMGSFNRRSSGRAKKPSLRFSVPKQSVSVWKNLESFENVTRPAQYLAAGSTVVLNLESVEDETECMRIFDFMNGVIFAMDGVVENISDRIKVYVPANEAVEIHDEPMDEEDGRYEDE